ncbi:MAG: type IV secretion system protein [Phycisphaerales bacterium]|nr:type IV secretion system protein [Phycisphaerales bacterium]
MTSLEANRVLPPPNEMPGASRKYLEHYGSAVVMNRYLMIAVLCLAVVSLGLLALNLKTFQTFRNFKPLVIRINEVGRAEAVAYDSMRYEPRDAELKYFLIQFVTKYYGRMRATVRENFARSLYFLDGRLADATIEANKKNKTIETFLAGQGEEIEIQVKHVSIEDLRQSPYKATVDFDKVYYTVTDRIESKREKYVASFIFIVRERVRNAWIPVNPLGLTITYFREDQAFQ